MMREPWHAFEGWSLTRVRPFPQRVFQTFTVRRQNSTLFTTGSGVVFGIPTEAWKAAHKRVRQNVIRLIRYSRCSTQDDHPKR
jgi:hypothetical protein